MNPDSSLMDRINEDYRKNLVPYSVLFELTYNCGLNCFHCYNTRKNSPELSTEEVHSVLKQLADLKCLYLTLSGGEPFQREDFSTILDKAVSLKFAVSIFTNATLVTKKLADELKEKRPLEINVTLFSADPVIHDKITGVPGSHKMTLRGLELMAGNELPLRIRCVLTKLNFHNYRELNALAQRYNSICQFDINLLPGQNNKSFIIKQRLETNEILSFLKDNGPVKMEHGEPFNNPDPRNWQLNCSMGTTSLAINPYGEILPCIHYPESAGNIRHQSIQEIWNTSSLLKKLRSIKTNDLEKCSACSHQSYCARCPAMAMKEDGDILGCSKWALKIAQLTQVQNSIPTLPA